MLKQLIFIGVFALLSVATFGQDKITIKAEKFSDLVPQSFYKTKYQIGYLFKVGDGEYQAVGYKAERLEEVLKTDELAYQEFEKFKRKITVGKVTYWVSLGSSYGLYLSQNNSDTIEQRRTKWIGSLVALFGGTTAYVLINKSATKHLLNSVEIYNQNLE